MRRKGKRIMKRVTQEAEQTNPAGKLAVQAGPTDLATIPDEHQLEVQGEFASLSEAQIGERIERNEQRIRELEAQFPELSSH